MNCISSTIEKTEENTRCVSFYGLNNELRNFNERKKQKKAQDVWVSRV